MQELNASKIAMDLTEDAVNVYNAIKDKFPSVAEFNKAPERLIAMGGDNADIVGALYKNSIQTAGCIARNSHGVAECANAISCLDRRVGLAILLGGGALFICGCIWAKLNRQEKEIEAMKACIAELENKKR